MKYPHLPNPFEELKPFKNLGLRLDRGEAVTHRIVNAPIAGSNPADPAKRKRGRPKKGEKK